MSTPEPMSYEQLVAVRVGLHQPDLVHLAQQVQAALHAYEDYANASAQIAHLRRLERAYDAAVQRFWLACLAARMGAADDARSPWLQPGECHTETA